VDIYIIIILVDPISLVSTSFLGETPGYAQAPNPVIPDLIWDPVKKKSSFVQSFLFAYVLLMRDSPRQASDFFVSTKK
jgi:hypothetical protein